VAAHRDDVLATVRKVAAREGADHPLEKIAGVQEEAGEIIILTTGVHLARSIGKALRRAWNGTLQIEEEDAVLGIRVAWRR
jgi:hypothetical protein